MRREAHTPKPSERPSAREIGAFLGYLAAGIALAALLYQALRYAALMIDRGLAP